MKRRLKINGVIIFLAVSLIALFPSFFFRKASENLSGELIEMFGIAFILLGQIFRVSARGYKSEHSGKGSVLIQTGPYALVRNPMYLGILLIGLGIILMLFQWWLAIVFSLIFTMRYILLIFKEEKKLSAIFGDEYRNYCSEVARILPSMVRISNTDISKYLPLKLSWIKKEIGTILAVLLITLVLRFWGDIKYNGKEVYLREITAIFIVIVLFICIISYLIKRTNSQEKNVSNKSKTAL